MTRFGWERVYEGGLRVYSTINMATQLAAETAVDAGLKSIEARRASLAAKRKSATVADEPSAPLQAALIAMEPDTGFVRAMVGGRDFDESHFNRAVQAKRQPGSAFKPFVYAAALEVGYTPATVIENLNAADCDAARRVDTRRRTFRGRLHESAHGAPHVEQPRGGPLASAGRHSQNGPVRQDDGSGQSAERALARAWVRRCDASVDDGGVRRLRQSRATCRGRCSSDAWRIATVICCIESTPSTTHAISPQTAFLMTTMMADVINAGTGARARSLGFTLPAAGKTGTTNDFNDAWFIGFTPSLVAGVWVGFDQPHTILPNGFAAEVAVPVWANFMKAATKGDKPVGFSTPPGIVTATVCRLSGKLAAEGCNHAVVLDDQGEVTGRSMVYTEYFARGTEPTAFCNLHPIGGFTGAVATVFTPSEKPDPVHIEPPRPPAAVVDRHRACVPRRRLRRPRPPKKKRGFWSKIFGGRDRANDEKKARQQ